MANRLIYCPFLMEDTLSGLVKGSKLQWSAQKLKNPFRVGMYVSEIRIFVNSIQTTQGVGPGDFWVKLAMGRQPLTSEFVPAWLLGRTLSNLQDVVITPAQGVNPVITPTFVWRFSKPMFMPAGETIQADLWVNPQDVANGALLPTVQIGIFGKMTPDRPKKTCIPFVSAFVGQKNAGGANYTDQSYERDLMNPFNVPLFVEEFVGRVGVTVGTGLWDSNANSSASAQDQAGATNTLVRGAASIGGQLVKDAHPFDALFYGPERAWRIHTWVDPKTFFKFYLQETYSALSASNSYRPEISLVGYREVILEA